ncbi:MAG TPA: hypothetical protein ENJ95_23155 [Bacteroidetes bacterium]|nr:hypothetical protein [Bacteroidota bacterium]
MDFNNKKIEQIKTTKTILIFCFLQFSVFSFGQISIKEIKNGEYGTPEERTLQIDSMMQTGLGLQEYQYPAVHEINLRFSIKVEEEVVRQELGNWSRYRRIMKIQKEKDKELKNVLTAPQYKKYEKGRDKMFWEGVKEFFF